MPTQAELPRRSLHGSHSWTDDLPICKNTGVGNSTNQIYREDGQRQEKHQLEDMSFHRSSADETVHLYGVFDGHFGTQAATFALQQLAAELMFGQLSVRNTDEEVKEVLRQAFIAVERNYLKSVDGKVAERTSLLFKIQEGLTPYEMEKLETLNYELGCGTTAVVALILGDRLFVANVGNSRALLCKTDDNGVLRVVQLSVDHDLTNEDEILRLFNLGLNFEKGGKLGNQEVTRCLGNYLVKGGYKDFVELNRATEEPVIAEPEIHGGIHIDLSCKFLLLMSDGLYKTLQEVKIEPEANITEHVNQKIAKMIGCEFKEQSNLMGVAQAVVDKVVRLHHDMYMERYPSLIREGSCYRDDITLLIRNFSNPLAQSSPHHPQESCRSDTDKSSSNSYSTNESIVKSQHTHVAPYVEFSQFMHNIETAKLNGTLHPGLQVYF